MFRRRSLPYILLMPSLFFVLVIYNACSQDHKFTAKSNSIASSSGETDVAATPSIFINDNSEFTRDKKINLTLGAGISLSQMYISNDKDCKTGQWQDFKENMPWDLSAENTEVAVYVKYRDGSAGEETLCVKDTIIHDNIAPVVDISSQVLNGWVKEPTLEVSILATDNLSGVDLLSCSKDKLNNYLACSGPIKYFNLQENKDYELSVIAVDRAGNKSEDPPLNWRVDLTPPVVTFNLTPAAVTADITPDFSYTAVDMGSDVARYECRLDGAAQFELCNTSSTLSNLSDGSHTFYVRAIDNVGHVSAVISYLWVQDTSAPTVIFTKTPDSITNNNLAHFEFQGLDNNSPINSFKCKLDGGSYVACSSPFIQQGLQDGSHSFSVIGEDAVKNESSPITYSWVIDTVAPAISFVQTPDKTTNSKNAHFQFSAQDNTGGVGIDHLECKLDSGSFTNCTTVLNLQGLSEGGHTILARSIDRAGNNSDTITYSWIVDTIKPTIAILTHPDNPTGLSVADFTFAGTDSGSGVDFYECKVDGGAYSSCASPYSTSNLSEGAHSFYVQVTDKAGNQSEPAIYQWEVDLTGPVITITEQPEPIISIGTEGVTLFTITDSSSGLNSYSCTLNGQTQACQVGQQLAILATIVQNFVLVISASDNVGNTSNKSIAWSSETPKTEDCEGIKAGDNIEECLAIIDSFERDEIVADNGAGFQWEEVIHDSTYSGVLVDSDIYSESESGAMIPDSILEMTPGYEDLNRAVFITGRPGGSVHSIYLISKPLNLANFDKFKVGFQYLPVDLEIYNWQGSGSERIRVEVCNASLDDCGIGASPNVSKLNGSNWEIIYESPSNSGSGFNGSNHVLADWVNGQAEFDMSSMPQSYKENFVFRFAVKIDEGFNSVSGGTPVFSAGMEDGVLLDNVIASASKK